MQALKETDKARALASRVIKISRPNPFKAKEPSPETLK